MFQFFQQTSYVSSGNYLTDQVTSGGILQLSRVQSFSIDLTFPLNEQSYLAEVSENNLIERPLVDFSFEYLATAGGNESKVGFSVGGIVSTFKYLNIEKNYYVQLEDDPVDANFPNTSTKHVIGIGNAVINGYSVAGSVGSLLRVTCQGQGLNMNVYTGNSGQYVPSINPITADPINAFFALPQANSQFSTDDPVAANNITALGAHDLVMEFPSGSVFATTISGDGCILQSFNLALGIDRSESRCLGYAYPSERRMNMPIHVNLSVEAVMNRYDVERLYDRLCRDTGHDINIRVNQPCTGDLAIGYYLRGLKLESQQIISNIGEQQVVNFNWVGVVNNLEDEHRNVFINATYSGRNDNTPQDPLMYYFYDTMDEYSTGTISAFPLNYKYLITGQNGDVTGIFVGTRTGFIRNYLAYWAADEFELYSAGALNSGALGINSGATLYTWSVLPSGF